jgi:hypothetical protein
MLAYQPQFKKQIKGTVNRGLVHFETRVTSSDRVEDMFGADVARATADDFKHCAALRGEV